MGIDLVVFIASALFGIFLYWRESNTNAAYRFVNRLVNSKELQMKKGDKKGFVYQQAFIPRLIFIAFSFLLIAVILQFMSPIDVFGNSLGISLFFTTIIGTVLGTYLANLVLKSGKIVNEKSDTLTDMVSETIDKGKEFLDDITTKDEVDNAEETPKVDETPKEEKKSARERLKDKGLM